MVYNCDWRHEQRLFTRGVCQPADVSVAWGLTVQRFIFKGFEGGIKNCSRVKEVSV